MPPFTSLRERRLWLWTLAVVVAIYSTLGPAEALVGFLRAHGLLRVTVALFALGFVAGLVLLGLGRRPRRGEIAVAIAVAVVYGLAWIRIHTPEERTHLIEYGVVAVLVHQALLERRRQRPRLPPPTALAALAVALTSLLGWLDEGLQAILPNRVYDIRDVGFNIFAALLAMAASLALAWVRRRRR